MLGMFVSQLIIFVCGMKIEMTNTLAKIVYSWHYFFAGFFFILSLVLRLGQTIGIFVVVVVFYKIIITMDIVIAISTI